PIALTVHDDSLYVLTADQVLRLDRAPDAAWDAPVVLIDDLPVSTGFWPSSLAVGPDARLYLSLGAACNACVQTDERLGALLSYDLDGSDEQIVARGFRTAADFAWNPETGALWIADSGRVTPPDSDFQPRDELNHVVPGAHYGFPHCYGVALPDDSLPAPDETFCESTVTPRLSFPYQSNPTGLTFYEGAAFPRWQGDLIIVLNGSWNLPAPAGYAVLINGFEQGQPDGTETYIAPTNEPAAPVLTLSEYSITGRGFFPDHPYDVAVSPEGWIYVSTFEGRLYRFRPRPAAR
ncbi:MAG: hypothetical protein GXY11_04300, partial [Clostridiales bacterium]|nr:hypothetical protein [Clostridiales bacterium]